MINRITILQRLIHMTRAKNYLEIGVNNGACFLRLKAPYKMAVDPAFKIPMGRKLKYFVKNPANFKNHYFEKTSDEFFFSEQETLLQHKPKIVFVDGLHTYEQALRDVLNSLRILEEGGMILMHDCNPLSEAAAMPGESIDHVKSILPNYGGVWNGDVWKAILHLRSLNHDLEVFVLDCDHGIGFVRKGKPQEALAYSEDEIKKFTYADLQRNRQRFLNLKSPSYFEQIVSSLTA